MRQATPTTTWDVNPTSRYTGDPARLSAEVDLQAAEICADRGIPEDQLSQRLVPLITAARLPEWLADWWLRHHRLIGAERDDYTSGMFIELYQHLGRIDRERIAAGASFCGWLRSWGRTAARKVAREVTASTSRAAIPAGRLITVGVGELERLACPAPPEAGGEDLVDPATVRASLARRRGAGRQEAVSRIVHDALRDVPPLLRPQDPADAQLVRRLIVQCPRLARISLDAFCARVDDLEPPGTQIAPEAMVAMWDATIEEQRQRLTAMPDQLLALLVQDAVRLAPRPRAAVLTTVRAALGPAAPQAPARLLDDLAQAFWDEATEAVSEHRSDITAAQRQQMREQAEVSARRLPDLVGALVQVRGQRVGRDVEEVLVFLRQAWATGEVVLSRRRRRAGRHRREGIPVQDRI